MKIKVSLGISVQYNFFFKRFCFLVYFEIIKVFSTKKKIVRRYICGPADLPLQIHGHQKFCILFKERSNGFCCYYARNSMMQALIVTTHSGRMAPFLWGLWILVKRFWTLLKNQLEANVDSSGLVLSDLSRDLLSKHMQLQLQWILQYWYIHLLLTTI